MTQPDPSVESSLYCLLYVSRLAPDASAYIVSHIAREAKVRNASTGVSGVLAFDGESFAQFVEGPSDAIDKLRERLLRDPRHRDVEILVSGSVRSRRFAGWQIGYVAVDIDAHELKHLRGLQGQAALEAMQLLLSSLDVGPSDPCGR